MSALRGGLVALVAVGILAAPAMALDLGDAAPPLKVEKWVKGGPIDLKNGKDKSIYLIEFWATWCGPCRASIPHLTELQKKYKDKGLVVIGVSVDNEKTRDNVKPFVDDMGDKMGYAVALDQKEDGTSTAYMKPFELDGIPSAFLVDKAGKLVWLGQGYPLVGVEEAIDQILAGKYDLKAAQQAEKTRRAEAGKRRQLMEKIQKYFELVSESEKPEGADKLGREVFAALGKDAMLLNEFSWEILTGEEIKYRDLKLALDVGKAAYDACEGKEAAIVDTYARALFDNGNVKDAIEYQKKAVQLAGDSPEMKKELEATLNKYEDAAKNKK
ncbi:MAG TPA: redoxin family protein [Phycisphaerae bacterium]|nr:redoxin family protein [Phycisphaerae bacterium]